MITQKRLKEVLHYDPEIGKFYWNICLQSKVVPGDRAGTVKDSLGYRRIGIDGYDYEEHRLAWFYLYNRWPNVLDHINGISDDNRISNLRECSYAENAWNRKKPSNNTTGIKGISWDEGLTNRGSPRYRARVMVNECTISKSFFIKEYSTRELALLAATTWVQSTREQLHGDFARHV